MSDEPWKDFGKILADIVVFGYIYLGILCVVVTVTVVLIVSYIKKRKEQKEESSDNKKFVPWRISIIILISALVLMTSPIIMGFFL